MHEQIRKHLIELLWSGYIEEISFYGEVFAKRPVLDHLAIIDLPLGAKVEMAQILEKIGFVARGTGYLDEKYNGFTWLAEEDFMERSADEILPQIIVADFNMDRLSQKVQSIITKYISLREPFDLDAIDQAIATKNPELAAQVIYDQLSNRPWPAPLIAEYEAVKAENELMAWVLACGRKVNHFGVSFHIGSEYESLSEFNNHLLSQNIPLNDQSGIIKGGEYCGIEQSSNVSEQVQIQLADGHIFITKSFMEFVWRFADKADPKLFSDYQMNFIPANANYVIESIYEKNH